MEIKDLNMVLIFNYLAWFGIPIFVYALPAKNSIKRFLLSILCTWIGLILLRLLTLPTLIEQAQSNGYDMYDGVGGNVAVLTCGWILGIISTVPVTLLRLIIDKVKKNEK